MQLKERFVNRRNTVMRLPALLPAFIHKQFGSVAEAVTMYVPLLKSKFGPRRPLQEVECQDLDVVPTAVEHAAATKWDYASCCAAAKKYHAVREATHGDACIV